MSDFEGSNALVSVVQFYSQALGREMQTRQQVEATLKQVLTQRRREDYPEREALIHIARLMAAEVYGGKDRFSRELCAALLKASDDYDRSILDPVEPDPARAREVRGAPADGSTEVPR